MNQPGYLFGDSRVALERLELLARVYQESTSTFLVKVAGQAQFPLALDLGCGPGFTTRLIADTLQCERVIGLDSSATFIELARANSSRETSFVQHDVTVTPFPSGPANLIFVRFLLTHLSDPAAVAAKWVTQLEQGGLLLLEETEAIHPNHPVFAHYLRIVEAMLAEHSNQLYAGRFVAGLNLQSCSSQVISELRRLAVRNCDAARMFMLNLRQWKENEFVRANYPTSWILELERALQELSINESGAREIEWQIRQAAWLKL